jgi:hypothetical protein
LSNMVEGKVNGWVQACLDNVGFDTDSHIPKDPRDEKGKRSARTGSYHALERGLLRSIE